MLYGIIGYRGKKRNKMMMMTVYESTRCCSSHHWMSSAINICYKGGMMRCAVRGWSEYAIRELR